MCVLIMKIDFGEGPSTALLKFWKFRARFKSNLLGPRNKLKMSILSVAPSSKSAPSVNPPKKLSKFHKTKERLCSHSLILEQLKGFTCKCRPSTCLTVSDAAFVGQVRSTCFKFKSRAEVMNFQEGG